MSVAAILRRAGFSPQCPQPVPKAGDAETLAAQGVPNVPSVPSENDREAAESADGRAAVDAQRARLLALAADELLPAGLVHGMDDGDAAACEGHTDDGLRGYLRALVARERMDAGMVPLEWGEPVARTCEGCGQVLLWRDCPAVVKACPWCFRRVAGKAIPRPCPSCGGGPGTHRCRSCYPDNNLPTLPAPMRNRHD